MFETTTKNPISTKLFSRLLFAYNCNVYVICIENKYLTVKMGNANSKYTHVYTLLILLIRLMKCSLHLVRVLDKQATLSQSVILTIPSVAGALSIFLFKALPPLILIQDMRLGIVIFV